MLIAESGCGVVKLHDHLGNAGLTDSQQICSIGAPRAARDTLLRIAVLRGRPVVLGGGRNGAIKPHS